MGVHQAGRRRLAGQGDEGACGQRLEGGLVADLAARLRVDALAVELPVELGRARALAVAAGRHPGGDEGLVVGAPAMGAGPVAGSQRHRLIEEKQLGVGAGPHHLLAAAAELDPAGDPVRVLPARGAEPALVVVQDAAVAHEQATRRMADDLAERRDPVLQRHPGPPPAWARPARAGGCCGHAASVVIHRQVAGQAKDGLEHTGGRC